MSETESDATYGAAAFTVGGRAWTGKPEGRELGAGPEALRSAAPGGAVALGGADAVLAHIEAPEYSSVETA